MRKLIVPTLILGITMFFVACGPSAEEKAAAEQHMKDSIIAAEKAIADSMLIVQQQAMQDSLAMVMAEQATQDSLAALKTGKPSTKPKPKPAPEKPKEAPKGMKDVAGDKKDDKKGEGDGKSMKDLMKDPK